MALKQGSERFTKWTHMENGKVLARRLHRMEVQARDGRLYVITGDDLPDALLTNSGHGHKGEHLAQILINPNRINTRRYDFSSCGLWPNGRDALNFILGFLATIAVRFIATLQFGP